MRFSLIMTARRTYRDDLIDECLDTVQATVNLLAAVGATQGEVDAAIRRRRSVSYGIHRLRRVRVSKRRAQNR